MKTTRILLLLTACAFSAVSCDKFLDMKPIDPMTTADDVFAKRATTEQYLYNVYTFCPKYWLAGVNGEGGEPWVPCSDEADVVFNNDFQQINNGFYNPSNPKQDKWRKYYQGIHEANYFMANLPKWQPSTVDEERLKEQYHYEARALRAYYYFLLMRQYGPVCLVGDEAWDAQGVFSKSRSPFDECVKYVSDELDAVAEKLPSEYGPTWYGKFTSGMALALKSRLLLYAASPLYNNNNSIYKDYRNRAGENLFATEYSEKKWKDAADAAKAVIDLNRYELMKEYDTVEDENNQGQTKLQLNPYKSMSKVFYTMWNKEVIFGRIFNDNTWYKRCTPRAAGSTSWGGFGVTQKQVDAYAMANGIYPISGYSNGDQSRPIVNPDAGYAETGATANYTNPYDGQRATTFNMYTNREPRFYMDVAWGRMTYPRNVAPNGQAASTFSPSYCNNGNSGPGTTQNYSTTGYNIRKLVPLDNDPENDKWRTPLVWPNIRLAEIYLNYVEALIECEPTNPDILKYWNELRERAGVPNIETAYPDVETNQTLMRELIRRERQVELSFENHRYFDVRRWMIAEETNNGYSYGMNVMADADTPVGTSEFWKRTPSLNQARVFSQKDYFFPIWQNHIDRDPLIEQSPFWK